MKNTDDIFVRSRLKRLSGRRSILLKAGASLLVVLTLGTLAYFLLREQNFSPPISIYTSNSVRRILLPDSSRVVLSRNSEFTYPSHYRGAAREVYLNGEAYFEVTPDSEKPFVVHTDKGDVKVVGTAFNLFTGEDRLEVAVTEGKVQVATPAGSSYIDAGYTGTLADGAGSIRIRPHTDVNAWSYATRRFVFKNTALPAVFNCIERSSAYTFQLKNKSIEKCKLTATFIDMPTEDMVSLIAESLNLTVTQDEYVFILQGEGCP